MIPNLPELTIGDSTPVQISPETSSPSSGSNSFNLQSQYSLLFITDGPLYLGASDVSSANASLMPAGFYPVTLQTDERLYGIAQHNTSVKVKRVAQGLVTTTATSGWGSSWGQSWGG